MIAARIGDGDGCSAALDNRVNRVTAQHSDVSFAGVGIDVDDAGTPAALRLDNIVSTVSPDQNVDMVAGMVNRQALAWDDKLTPDLLRQVGEAVHGKRWRNAIACSLGVNERHLRKWIARERPIPVDRLETLIKLLRRKHQEIQAARDRLALIYENATR